MKKVLFGLFLLGFISTGQSQILLEEAEVVAKRPSMKVDVVSNSLVIQVPEIIAREFQKDPVSFVRNNFDSAQLVADNDQKFDGYEVDFKSSKGHLLAKFNKRGEIISTHQRFKDALLPLSTRIQLQKEYTNGKLLSSVYIADTDKWEMRKEFYRVKIKDGKKVRRLKIGKDSKRVSLALR